MLVKVVVVHVGTRGQSSVAVSLFLNKTYLFLYFVPNEKCDCSSLSCQRSCLRS